MTNTPLTWLVLYRDVSPIYRKHLRTFCDLAATHNIRLVLFLHHTPQPSCLALQTWGSLCILLDLDDHHALRAQVTSLHAKTPIARLFAFIERDVYPAALCREDNEIPGMRPDAAIHFRNKHVMHARAAELGLTVPRSCLPYTFGQLSAFINEVGYPIVLKPYNGAGSHRTYCVRDIKEATEVWASIKNERFFFRAEAFVEGQQYFVDTLMQNGTFVFSSVSSYTYRVFHFRNEIPGAILHPPPYTGVDAALCSTTQMLLSGLGMQDGFAHTELFVTNEGKIVLGETAARFGGGPIPMMLQHAYGFDPIEAWFHLAHDPAYQVQSSPQPWVGAEYFSIDHYAAFGTITAISQQEDLLSCEGVLDAEVWREVGDHVAVPERCTDVLGYMICRAPSKEELQRRFAEVRACFQIQTTSQ